MKEINNIYFYELDISWFPNKVGMVKTSHFYSSTYLEDTNTIHNLGTIHFRPDLIFPILILMQYGNEYETGTRGDAKSGVESDFLDESYTTIWGGCLISEKVKNILSGFNLPPHKYYPVKVVHEDTEIPTSKNYFHLQVLRFDYSSYVDLSQSIFSYYDKEEKKKKPLIIANQEELAQMIFEKRTTKRFEKLVLKKEVFTQKPYDLFLLEPFTMSHVISDNLKKAFEEKDVTGLEDFKLLPIYFDE
jgi:hypothetical protein